MTAIRIAAMPENALVEDHEIALMTEEAAGSDRG
jgi:hypothetical protein